MRMMVLMMMLGRRGGWGEETKRHPTRPQSLAPLASPLLELMQDLRVLCGHAGSERGAVGQCTRLALRPLLCFLHPGMLLQNKRNAFFALAFASLPLPSSQLLRACNEKLIVYFLPSFTMQCFMTY